MISLKNKPLFQEQCYINGQWIDAFHKKTIAVLNPFDNQVLGHIPDCGKEETQAAIQAASKAWQTFKMTTAKERADLLWHLADRIEANKEDLAMLMTLEQGKPLKESRAEIAYGNGFVKWFAEEARRTYGDIIPSNERDQHLLVIKQPIGVVGAITPWNFPMAMITRKCAPALAAGCTVILKPASETPFSALALAKLCDDVGFPPGVFNIITGTAKTIGLELTTNPLVRKISFTGSTAVGKLLMQQSASTVKKISLELGGNAPFIVFDDADLDLAVDGAIASKFRNTGQTCVCANRIFVQDRIYADFTEKLMAKVKSLRVGNGLDPEVDLGPLINEAAVKKVETHIQDAVNSGATLALGGKRCSLGPLFFEPTVLTNMNQNMLIANEETFGPVAPLFRFQTDAEVIDMANNTPFGLASYFYSRDIHRIWQVAQGLEYGMVGVNTGIVSTEVAPFGGIKESGIGREGSKYGIDEYVEIKYICMK